MNVCFELYGVARRHAGQERVPVTAGTVGEALAALEKMCPALSGHVVVHGRLTPHYRLSLNGRSFVSRPENLLSEGDTLIVLSAAVGG